MRVPGHERIVAKPGIGLRVGDDEPPVFGDHMLAEADFARLFERIEPIGGFEPKPVIVEEGYKRDRRFEQIGDELRYPVKGRVGLGVENMIFAERSQPSLLVELRLFLPTICHLMPLASPQCLCLAIIGGPLCHEIGPHKSTLAATRCK